MVKLKYTMLGMKQKNARRIVYMDCLDWDKTYIYLKLKTVLSLDQIVLFSEE